MFLFSPKIKMTSSIPSGTSPLSRFVLTAGRTLGLQTLECRVWWQRAEVILSGTDFCKAFYLMDQIPTVKMQFGQLALIHDYLALSGIICTLSS